MMDSGELLVELSGFWRACSAGGVDLLVSGDGRQLRGNTADGTDNGRIRSCEDHSSPHGDEGRSGLGVGRRSFSLGRLLSHIAVLTQPKMGRNGARSNGRIKAVHVTEVIDTFF